MSVTVRPRSIRTRSAPRCRCGTGSRLPPGETAEVRLRLRPSSASRTASAAALAADVDAACRAAASRGRRVLRRADPGRPLADEAAIMRQAFAGMLWSKQLYDYDIQRWLDGDPDPAATTGVAADRPELALDELRRVRHHVDARQVGVPVVRGLGPRLPLRGPGPRGSGLRQVPAAAAVPRVVPAPERRAAGLRVGLRRCQPAGPGMGGARGVRHRRRRATSTSSAASSTSCSSTSPGGSTSKTPTARNLFEGGFLGLDNIGPIDRSHLPVGGTLQQSDATGWMAFYALAMAAIATILNRTGQRPASDLVLKFLEHFAAIRGAMDALGRVGRRRRSVLRQARHAGRRSRAGQGPIDGRHHPAAGGRRDRRARASTGPSRWARVSPGCVDELGGRDGLASEGLIRGEPGHAHLLLGVVGVGRLEKVFAKLFDPEEFLSPYGLRALSAYHRDHPYELDVEGVRAAIDYEPAESTTAMFGGNSNWRGPIWFPLNYLLIERAGPLRPVLRRRLRGRVPDG